MLHKLTHDEVNAEIAKITDLGNPEMQTIIDTAIARVKDLGDMIAKYHKTKISEWFFSRHLSESPTEKFGDSAWTLAKIIQLVDAPDVTDHCGCIYNVPEAACVMLYVRVEIPNFKGKDLNIPDGKRIRFNCGSHWDIFLIHPKVSCKSEPNRTERLAYATSLNIDRMFILPPEDRAYILTKFDEFATYYRYLDAISSQ